MISVSRVLLVDNYDSFTYNLKMLVKGLTPEVQVLENDHPDLLEKDDFSHLILSPGPKDPSDSGLCRDLVRKWSASKPVLGVCLGHQIIADVYGAKVIKAPYPIHGKTSQVQHFGGSLFEGVPQEFKVARYHSLVVDPSSLESSFRVSAEHDKIIMALSHRDYPYLHGVQFHPESFLSEHGERLLKNFLSMNYE